MKNYYKILRIPLLSSEEMVKDAYRKLAKQYHPDKNHGVEFFNIYFAEIKEAYDFLMNQEDKAKYDDIIRVNPELIEETALTISDKSELQFKQNDGNRHFQLKISYKTISLVFFILFTLAIVIYRTKGLDYFSNSKIKNAKNNTTLDSIIDKDLNQKSAPKSVDSHINDKEIQEINLKYQPTTVVKEKEISKSKASSANYCEKITAEVNGDELNIINKNKFTVFRVEVEITRLFNRNNHYDPNNHYGSASSMPRFESEFKTYFEVQPGVNWKMSGDRDLFSAKVLSCELN